MAGRGADDLKVPVSATIPAIENCVRELGSSQTQPFLQLPKELKHQQGGGVAALAQLLITWARQREGPVKAWLTEPQEIQDFVRQLPGLVASLTAKQITSGKDGTDLSAIASRDASERIAIMQHRKPHPAFRGRVCEIVCADHIGYDTPYAFYHPGDRRVREREEFDKLAQWLLNKTILTDSYHKNLPNDLAPRLGGMVYELIKNTEEHGRIALSGDQLPFSLRGLRTQHHALTPQALQRVTDKYPKLKAFCDSLQPPREASQVHFFELSVFDSGVGFASSWTGRAIDSLGVEEERDAVLRCFLKGETTKGSRRFGQGLSQVLGLLQELGGFLRLRTGRTILHRHFESAPTVSPPLLSERDMEIGAPAVEGSVLTLLLPLWRHW